MQGGWRVWTGTTFVALTDAAGDARFQECRRLSGGESMVVAAVAGGDPFGERTLIVEVDRNGERSVYWTKKSVISASMTPDCSVSRKV